MKVFLSQRVFDSCCDDRKSKIQSLSRTAIRDRKSQIGRFRRTCWRALIRSSDKLWIFRLGKEAMKGMPIVFLLATFVLSPFHPAEAQKPPTIRKIGFLGSAAMGFILSYEGFRQRLRELG